MGTPSQEQIDEAIANGLALRQSEEEILATLLGLERMSDEELAAVGVIVAPADAIASDSAPV